MTTSEKNHIELIDYSDPDNLQISNPSMEEFFSITKARKSMWVNIEHIDGEKETDRILEHMGIHNILTESILDDDTRPKFQEFEDYYFFAIRAAVGLENNTFQTQEINLLLKRDFFLIKPLIKKHHDKS